MKLVFILAALAATVALASRAPAQDLGSFGQYEKIELIFPYIPAPTFADIRGDYWAFDGIEACAAAGIVTGYNDRTFRPALSVDRAQMSVFIARALTGGEEYVPTGPSVATFPDVPLNHWAFKYVEYAKQTGVVQGYDDGLFQPERPLDRAQAAVFVARAISTPTGEPLASFLPPTKPTFADVPTSFWAYKHIEFLAARGVVHGYPDGLYHPSDSYARDQLTVYISRAFGLAAPLGGAADNPFDPDQIDVTGEFHTPSGQIVTVPGFYYRPHRRSLTEYKASREETLIPERPEVFKVRFAWGEIGEYTFQAMVRDTRGTRMICAGTFTVTASADNGYIHPSPAAPNHLQFDSGRPYFAIGANMCWPWYGGTYDYDRWMAGLAEDGGNFILVWLTELTELYDRMTLERLSVPPSDDDGLGRYDQEAAWRVDYVLDLARELGVSVLLAIDCSSSLDDSDSRWAAWHRNPYNYVNGGPCGFPSEFFTSPKARRLYQQRLRYLVARWGYATSLLGWEFWVEIDGVSKGIPQQVVDWHREMGAYLLATDPWSHLITTTFSQGILATECPIDPALDAAPELSLIQSHRYDAHDTAAVISQLCRQHNRDYGKPHLVGEFGADPFWDDNQHIYLHEGLWSSMMSPAAGAVVPWQWDDRALGMGLYHEFAPVAAFAADVNWVKENYQPAIVAGIRYVSGYEPSGPATLAIEPPFYSCRSGSPPNLPGGFVVGNDGVVTGLDTLSFERLGTLQECANPVTFQVNYPVPGRFEVLVWGVVPGGGATLRISVDGTQALVAGFPAGVPDDRGVIHQYDGLYGIDVASGPHAIVIESIGPSMFYASYRLTNYVTTPNLRALAVSNPTSALVWVQNKQYTWWNLRTGLQPQPVATSEIALTGFTPGAFRIEQWDTCTGAAADTTTYTSPDGTIIITTPDGLATDVAYKIRKQ